ncbi:MAG TPA: alpha-ribazole phosphatase [Gallionella sp.]|nr:alpha-ribazole phosphatase [Gallionella sp.]
MKTLYLIRHTRPRIAPGICYGQLDIDVADSFEAEAHNILRCLPPLQLVIASPLRRTRRLGEYLAHAQHCELRSDARLMEKHFGSWEGKEWDDIARSEIDAWAADVMGYAPRGGESAQQVMQRVHAFMYDLAQLPQQSIALAAHGGSIRAMLALTANVPLANTLNWQMNYGAVICVRFAKKEIAPSTDFTPA